MSASFPPPPCKVAITGLSTYECARGVARRASCCSRRLGVLGVCDMSYGVGSVSFTRVRSGAVTAIAVRLVPSHCQIGTSYRGFGISRWVAMLRSCRRPRDLTVFTRVDARHTYVRARGETWERGVVVDDRAAPAAGGGEGTAPTCGRRPTASCRRRRCRRRPSGQRTSSCTRRRPCTSRRGSPCPLRPPGPGGVEPNASKPLVAPRSLVRDLSGREG